MILKRFENFINSNGEFVAQLVQAGVVNKEVIHSTDFINKLNAERESTALDYLLPLVNDFNQHKDLDFVDFWNKKKSDYNLPSNIKDLDGEKALNKFFNLGKKLTFKNNIIKDFLDRIGVPEKPSMDDQGIVQPDASRNGSIVVGSDKDNIRFDVKKSTQFQNRKMY